MASVTVVVPTYKEAENIPVLVKRLCAAFASRQLNCSIIIVDDNSRDGTQNIVTNLSSEYPVKLHLREKERGLSSAVLAGFERADGEIFVCMDADLSHPPEKVIEMCDIISSGEADFVIGSRNVPGGSADSFNFYRRSNAFLARMLAFPLARISDPMAGFFAFRSQLYTTDLISQLNPVGWKICLEILVKMNPGRVREIPIIFEERLYGCSKLSFKEQINYLIHLKRLYCYKFKGIARFAVFSLVGASGIAVDLGVVYGGVEIVGVPFKFSRIAGIVSAMTTNYLLNRFFTFEERPARGFFLAYLGFVIVCSLGALLNWRVSLYFHDVMSLHYMLASLIGIIAGTLINFSGSTLLVFRK